MQDTLTTALLRCGVIAGPLYIIVGAIQVLVRPGFDVRYNVLSQMALGDLGWIQTANFAVSGLLVLAGAIGISRAIRSGRGATCAPYRNLRCRTCRRRDLQRRPWLRLPARRARGDAHHDEHARAYPLRAWRHRLLLDHRSVLRPRAPIRQERRARLGALLGFHRCVLPAGVPWNGLGFGPRGLHLGTLGRHRSRVGLALGGVGAVDQRKLKSCGSRANWPDTSTRPITITSVPPARFSTRMPRASARVTRRVPPIPAAMMRNGTPRPSA